MPEDTRTVVHNHHADSAPPFNMEAFHQQIKHIESHLTSIEDLPRMLEVAEQRFVAGMASCPDHMNAQWYDSFMAIRMCKELVRVMLEK